MFQQKFKVYPYLYLLSSVRKTFTLLSVLSTSTFILGFSSKLSTASSWSGYRSTPAFISYFCPPDQALPLFLHLDMPILGQEGFFGCLVSCTVLLCLLSSPIWPTFLISVLSYLILTLYDSAMKKHFTA